jgi:ribosome maturation factor RimP
MIGIGTLEKIEHVVEGITLPWQTVFVVDIKISATNDIKVFLDADDGITIEKCTAVNRALYKYIEESGLFPDGNFSLEVSSPGIDQPLKLHRQYLKNVGRKIEVTMNDGNKIEGKLKEVSGDAIELEPINQKGKKRSETNGMITTSIFLNQIKYIKVLITF